MWIQKFSFCLRQCELGFSHLPLKESWLFHQGVSSAQGPGSKRSVKKWKVLRSEGGQDGSVFPWDPKDGLFCQENTPEEAPFCLILMHHFLGSRWGGIFSQWYTLSHIFSVLFLFSPLTLSQIYFFFSPSSSLVPSGWGSQVYHPLTLWWWCADELWLTQQPAGLEWGNLLHRGTHSKQGCNCPEPKMAKLYNNFNSNNKTRMVKIWAYMQLKTITELLVHRSTLIPSKESTKWVGCRHSGIGKNCWITSLML